jgi:LPXTG-site transpeptidase (sortase) family protein
MLRTKKGKWGLMLLGLAVFVWGATSAFSDWKTLASLQPDALDNPDANSSQWIYPSGVPTRTAAAAQTDLSASATSTPFLPAGAPPQMAGEPTLAGDAQAFTVPFSPGPTATPAAAGLDPDRIVIPDIKLDAPIMKVPFRLVKDDATNLVFQQWLVPDQYAAGWQGDSAQLGVPGNTVLDGHHNEYGKVFRYLIDLNAGQTIELYSGTTLFKYTITNKMILLERNQPLSVRFSNARWLLPSTDERITLVTCWPYTSNTHRLIIVAVPSGKVDASSTKASP